MCTRTHTVHKHMVLSAAKCPHLNYYVENTLKIWVRSQPWLQHRECLRDGEKGSTVQHPTLCKQGSQAIFISQLDLYGDSGWGWNFLYRNLASPDQKPVGFLRLKERAPTMTPGISEAWAHQYRKPSHWFHFLRKRDWITQHVFLVSRRFKIDPICGSQTSSIVHASNVSAWVNFPSLQVTWKLKGTALPLKP